MEPNTLTTQLQERLKELPPVVQDAILSVDVEKHLRELSDKHKLHLDQWQLLENEVMLTLLGFEQPEDLAANLKAHIRLPDNLAQGLAADISRIVFEPIRQELERQLAHPGAETAVIDGTQTALDAARKEEGMLASSAPAVQPATPPQPTPDIKVARPSESSAYKPGEASHERKNIADDPYRESIA